jgi:Serine acetyltransferase
MFNQLINLNCHSNNQFIKEVSKNLLEKLYGCEINCIQIDKSVLFAHHARGCTIVASKIYENVVIYQNVTIGSNMKYNKTTNEWENVANPVICKNVIIADGAKILGPIIIGEGCVIAAGAIVTKDMPANSVVYGVNQFRPKDSNYDLIFNKNMVTPEKIIAACNQLIKKSQSNPV